jgi:predicted permease
MARVGEAWRRWLLVARRGRRDTDLEEEIRFHLEMRAAEHRASGMDAVEADYAARRRFGSPALVAEESRDASGWPVLESVCQDTRFALRSLRKSPAFVLVTLLSLALGIGVSVAVFSFVSALYLGSLDGVADPGRLVSIGYVARGGPTGASYPDFEYVRARTRRLSDLLAYSAWTMTVWAGGGAETVTGELVSPNFFSVLGTKASAGRTFLASEGQRAGADAVAVVSYNFWQRRLSGDRGVVGRPLRIGGTLFTIIGVAPPGFRGLSLDGERPPSLWVPASMADQTVPDVGDLIHEWGNESFTLVGRLAPGASLAAATAELSRLAARVGRDHPEWTAFHRRGDVDRLPVVSSAAMARVSGPSGSDIGRFLGLLGAASGLIYLIACTNVASLVLARTSRRQKQFALQLSLGATRRRVFRQLLTENLLLALSGGVAGLAVARWSAAALAWSGQAFHTPVAVDSIVDLRVLIFAVAIAVACALGLTGLSARVAARTPLAAGDARRGVHAQQALVAAQVALSVVLLVGASLFLQTLRNARAVDPTANPQDVLVSQVDLAGTHCNPVGGRQIYARLLDRVRALPGVKDAALVMVVPLGGRRGGTDVMLDGEGVSGTRRPIQIGLNIVTSRYFSTVGLPVVAGRDLTETDRAEGPQVAVINETMATRLFRGRDPIGQRIRVEWDGDQTVVVVGVVRDGRFRTYRSAMEPTVYVPLAQHYQPQMNLEVRLTAGQTRAWLALQREAAAVDGNLALVDARTLSAHFDSALARERLVATLLGVLGLFALALAAVGVYGVVSYAVTRRTKELGIRVALGARPRALIRAVVGRMARLVAAGLAAGTVAALLLARLARGLLFGVEPTDPASFAATIAALAVVAVAWLPAWRAARADPVAAVRRE